MSIETRQAENWDNEVAGGIVGKVVLIGLTHHVQGEADVRYEQMYGVVVSADPGAGFCVELQGSREGDSYWLPPQINRFVRARPGTYRLSSTGEDVENPDYISQWVVNPRTT